MKRADGTAEMVWGGYEGDVERVAKLYAERLLATGTAPTSARRRTGTRTDQRGGPRRSGARWGCSAPT